MSNQKKNLSQVLSSIQRTKYTGRIRVQSKTGIDWRIYSCLGRLVWIDGGSHPHRSWQRHMVQYLPHAKLRKADFVEAAKLECWNYHLLPLLLKRDTIKRDQVIALIHSKIAEVLFDIWQHEVNGSLKYQAQSLSADLLLEYGLKTSLALVVVEKAFIHTKRNWLQWSSKGLGRLSPNLAPSLKQQDKLQQEVPAQVYQNFVRLIDGKHTLRDLAVQMNRHVFQLTSSLIPYLRKGFVELKPIDDLSLNEIFGVFPDILPQSQISSQGNEPLIACIDDSIQICRIMQQILNRAGYRFICIQDSLKAIPTLISHQPDLIFLDIGMPVMNGYEICTQIKRVAQLKHIPVVFLTGNDGIVDRMRAKVTGASGFLSKPIEIDKIISTVQKLSATDDEEKLVEERESTEFQVKSAE